MAGEWSSYANARFGATIDIPPGFVNDVQEPANGDGLTFHSADGKAELLVSQQELAITDALRRAMADRDVDMLVDGLRKTQSNAEFLLQMSR